MDVSMGAREETTKESFRGGFVDFEASASAPSSEFDPSSDDERELLGRQGAASTRDVAEKTAVTPLVASAPLVAEKTAVTPLVASAPSASATTAEAGPGPSAQETSSRAWLALDQSSQRRWCAGARTLNAFVRDTAHAYITPKGDQRTNIIDQGERETYCMGADTVNLLCRHLDSCRREGVATHFSERQGTPTAPRCGIMIDYDIVTSNARPTLTNRHYHRIASSLAATLQRDIDFADQLPRGKGGRLATEMQFHLFFIIKPAAVPISAPNAAGGSQSYKFGFHILIPGIRLGRAYKKWLIREFKGDGAVASVLTELGASGDPAACLDPNSASVPVLFFGSCKRGGTPYGLGAALEVTLDLAAGATWTPAPIVRELDAAALAGFNLVAEMSLTVDAAYDDDRAPLVRATEFDCRPELADRVRDWGDRSAAAVTPAEELLLAEHSLSTLTLHNAEARHLHALLDLLSEDYASQRDLWRDVIFALANTNEQYKPLAVWFSHKCPRQWAGGGLDALDSLWEDALARRGSCARPLTLSSISWWARSCNPARYAEVMERSYFTMLTQFVYDYGGKLEHFMVAKVLHAMLGTKFVVDIEPSSRGVDTYRWFEFVLPGQPMRPGEVWKWRRETEPDDIQLYLSEKFPRILDQISEHIEERRIGAAEETQAKYYQQLGKSFAATKKSFFNDTFKNGVIRQAAFLFRRRGFVAQLDRIPDLFGTLDGVLRLGPRIQFINHYHELPISAFSPVAWKPFNPDDPWTRLALRALADIIIEPDVRDWIIFHAAQALGGHPKEGLMLLCEGGGQNGKTAVLRWFAKALGPYADKFNVQLLSSDREEADKPNSAVMKFKHLNYAYCEETKKSQVLNEARMKELVNPGDVSGRDLNSRQETFAMRCNFVVASQFSFVIPTTDHGTWRRIRHYTAKRQFRANPDPNNPLEMMEDQRFILDYPNDPQFISSMLSILAHYYERLQNEYGGQLKRVPSPTLDRETEEFRIGQDSLHRWICEAIIISPRHDSDYPVGVLGGYYSEWYNRTIDRHRHAAGDVIKAIEGSAISKYLAPAPNRTFVLRGCRVIINGESPSLQPGEEYFGSRGAEAREAMPMCAHDIGTTAAWWAARAPPRPPVVAPLADEEPPLAFELGLDDAEVMRVAPRAADNVLVDQWVEHALASTALASTALEERPDYSLDDVWVN